MNVSKHMLSCLLHPAVLLNPRECAAEAPQSIANATAIRPKRPTAMMVFVTASMSCRPRIGFSDDHRLSPR